MVETLTKNPRVVKENIKYLCNHGGDDEGDDEMCERIQGAGIPWIRQTTDETNETDADQGPRCKP